MAGGSDLASALALSVDFAEHAEAIRVAQPWVPNNDRLPILRYRGARLGEAGQDPPPPSKPCSGATRGLPD